MMSRAAAVATLGHDRRSVVLNPPLSHPRTPQPCFCSRASHCWLPPSYPPSPNPFHNINKTQPPCTPLIPCSHERRVAGTDSAPGVRSCIRVHIRRCHGPWVLRCQDNRWWNCRRDRLRHHPRRVRVLPPWPLPCSYPGVASSHRKHRQPFSPGGHCSFSVTVGSAFLDLSLFTLSPSSLFAVLARSHRDGPGRFCCHALSP